MLLFNELNLKVNIQHSSSSYISDVWALAACPLAWDRSSFFCSWEIASKVGVIWMKNILWLLWFSMDPVLFINMCLSFKERNILLQTGCWDSTWIHGNAFHSHWWLRRYFYFCTSVLDLLSIFLSTSHHQKDVPVCVGQFCINRCHTALMLLAEKDWLLQLRILKSIMMEIKCRKSPLWDPDSVLGKLFCSSCTFYTQATVYLFLLLTSQQSPEKFPV